MKPKLLVFASGTKLYDTEKGGGSGFQKLFEATQTGILQADIVAVVSNHEKGGVRARAEKLGVPFIYSPKPRTASDYQKIVSDTGADFIALSGWLALIEGLPANKTFNIHPAWLPSPFGGDGFYGHHVHEAVIKAYKEGKVTHAGVTMHFVTEKYDDDRAIFFRRRVEILPDDTPETLAKRVNEMEHKWQAIITNKVVSGEISWDGKDFSTMKGADLEN